MWPISRPTSTRRSSMLKPITLCVNQGCARGLFSRDRGARPRPWSPRPRSRRPWQFKPRRDRDQGLQSSKPRRGRGVPTPRRDRAEALLRLETASRPSHQDRGHILGVNKITLRNAVKPCKLGWRYGQEDIGERHLWISWFNGSFIWSQNEWKDDVGGRRLFVTSCHSTADGDIVGVERAPWMIQHAVSIIW